MARDWLCILPARTASVTVHNGYYFPSKQMNETALLNSSTLPLPPAPLSHRCSPSAGCKQPTQSSQSSSQGRQQGARCPRSLSPHRQWRMGSGSPTQPVEHASIPPAFSCQPNIPGHSAI